MPPAGGQQLVPAATNSNDPFGIFGSPTPPQQSQPQLAPQQQLQKQLQQLHFHDQLNHQKNDLHDPKNESMLPDPNEEEGLALVDIELDGDNDEDRESEEHKKDGEFLGNANARITADNAPAENLSRARENDDIAPPPPPTPGRQHAEYLSQTSAPPGASPLPLPSLVRHSGYVLSRISFRTILLRKWKQTFWIQYGPTQLLFFRTHADYQDWLNNPYHSQQARDFLVKLRVDFVSDLKKPSVMGYQVTQIRRKPYGRNVM